MRWSRPRGSSSTRNEPCGSPWNPSPPCPASVRRSRSATDVFRGRMDLSNPCPDFDRSRPDLPPRLPIRACKRESEPKVDVVGKLHGPKQTLIDERGEAWERRQREAGPWSG